MQNGVNGVGEPREQSEQEAGPPLASSTQPLPIQPPAYQSRQHGPLPLSKVDIACCCPLQAPLARRYSVNLSGQGLGNCASLQAYGLQEMRPRPGALAGSGCSCGRADRARPGHSRTRTHLVTSRERQRWWDHGSAAAAQHPWLARPPQQ